MTSDGIKEKNMVNPWEKGKKGLYLTENFKYHI
jgi:hypothetical protein